ncbi:MAG TPA: hypothetical protein VMC05_07195 [Xanthobacteraceae bacterium]|nr:hypothetical protein [Xanthobacteraceae bacterium]
MPALLWVAFWSSLMGSAACWGESRRPVPCKLPARRDQQHEPSSR